MSWKSLFTAPAEAAPREHYPVYPPARQESWKESLAKPLQLLKKTYKKAILGVLGTTAIAAAAHGQEQVSRQSIELLSPPQHTVAFDNGTPDISDLNEKNVEHSVSATGHEISFRSTNPRGSYTILPGSKGDVKGFRDVSRVQKAGKLRLFIEDSRSHKTYSIPFPKEGSLHLPKDHPLFTEQDQQCTYSIGSINAQTGYKEVYSTAYNTGTTSSYASQSLEALAQQTASPIEKPTEQPASQPSLPQEESIPHDPLEIPVTLTIGAIAAVLRKRKEQLPATTFEETEEQTAPLPKSLSPTPVPLEVSPEQVTLEISKEEMTPVISMELETPVPSTESRNTALKSELDILYHNVYSQTEAPYLKTVQGAIRNYYNALVLHTKEYNQSFVGIFRNISNIVETLHKVSASLPQERIQVFCNMLSRLLQNFRPQEASPKEAITFCMQLKDFQGKIQDLIPVAFTQNLETIMTVTKQVQTQPTEFQQIQERLSQAVLGLRTLFEHSHNKPLTLEHIKEKLQLLGYLPSTENTKTALEKLKSIQYPSLIKQEPVGLQHIKNPAFLSHIFLNPAEKIPAIDAQLLLQILSSS